MKGLDDLPGPNGTNNQLIWNYVRTHPDCKVIGSYIYKKILGGGGEPDDLDVTCSGSRIVDFGNNNLRNFHHPVELTYGSAPEEYWVTPVDHIFISEAGSEEITTLDLGNKRDTDPRNDMINCAEIRSIGGKMKLMDKDDDLARLLFFQSCFERKEYCPFKKRVKDETYFKDWKELDETTCKKYNLVGVHKPTPK